MDGEDSLVGAEQDDHSEEDIQGTGGGKEGSQQAVGDNMGHADKRERYTNSALVVL